MKHFLLLTLLIIACDDNSHSKEDRTFRPVVIAEFKYEQSECKVISVQDKYLWSISKFTVCDPPIAGLIQSQGTNE